MGCRVWVVGCRKGLPLRGGSRATDFNMIRVFAIAVLLSASALAQPAPARQFLFRLQTVRADFTLQNMTEDEQKIVGRHVAYLQGLLADGKLTFAGQAFDPKGFWGIVVVNAADLDAATALMNGDPAVKEKLVRGEAIPFRTVFAAPPPTRNSSSPGSKGTVGENR